MPPSLAASIIFLDYLLYKLLYFKNDCNTYSYIEDITRYTTNNDRPCFNKSFYKIHFVHL